MWRSTQNDFEAIALKALRVLKGAEVSKRSRLSRNLLGDKRP